MYRTAALKALREKLSAMNVSAIIIPTNDPHFGEYTQDHYKVREWLSGFNGSAGTLVVTLKGAALWTDSRYFVQAAAQLQGSEIKLMRMKMEGTPSIAQWILGQYPEGELVAIDQSLFSCSEYELLCNELVPCKVKLIDDIFSDLWSGRPSLKFNPVIWLDTKYTGESAKSKHERIVAALGLKEDRFAYIVTMCDEVAWLCNIRGTDIEYNPLAQSYAILTNTSVHLFADLDSIDEQVREKLLNDNIELHPYNAFSKLLSELPAETVRVISKGKTTIRDYMAMNVPGARFMNDPVPGGAVNYYKSIKNNWEQDGFAKAFLADGVAWCKVLKFIDLLDVVLSQHASVGVRVVTTDDYHSLDAEFVAVGILLCTKKGKKMVEYALAGLDNKIFVSTYMLALPDKKQLEDFLKKELGEEGK